MRQEKWDKLNKKLDGALEAEFGTLKSVFENAKLVLREHLLANKEQVAKDLQEMQEKSSKNEQERVEEAALKYKNLKLPDDLYDAFISGANWQQERMYSEKAMIEFAKLHVKAALKQAAHESQCYNKAKFPGDENWTVDIDSILNSYPLDKIK